jgi:hypothetical protein
MTIVDPDYFEETIGRLRGRGHDVRHFALLAQRETVLRRLHERGLGHAVQLVAGTGAALRQESFALARVDLCLERLVTPEFAEHVWTDHITISEVADRIARSAGLSLAPNTEPELLGRLRRWWTGAKHIRFD